MNHFTIKDIENLSGIRAHTLRIWEQRYNICIPQRKESNHRFYDNSDLKNILKISYLYHRGLKISKIAKFATEDLNRVADNYFSDDITHEHYITRLLESSLDFNEEAFEKIYNEAEQLNGVEVTIKEIVYPYLEKVGMLWLTDHVIPAQEHFTSNLINRKILLAIDKLTVTPKAGARDIVLFAPQKEHHEIPLLLLYFMFKKNGDRVIYFGPNALLKTIKYYTDYKHVSHLYFHMITNLTSQTADEYVEQLSKTFPDKLIVASGPIAKNISKKYSHVEVLASRKDVEKFIHS